MMEEHPDFPIEEIERANLALEKAGLLLGEGIATK